MIVLVILLQLRMLFDGESAPAPVEPTPVVESATGVATWYRYHTGQAAAGPALRELLGKNWKAQTVTVSTEDGASVTVVLTDWCQCYFRMPDEKLIDLDYYDFQKLASPTRGILKVTVTAH